MNERRLNKKLQIKANRKQADILRILQYEWHIPNTILAFFGSAIYECLQAKRNSSSILGNFKAEIRVTDSLAILTNFVVLCWNVFFEV